MFEAGRVVAEGNKGEEEVQKDVTVDLVKFLPYPVEYAIRPRGRRRGALAESLFDIVRGEGGCIRVRCEPASDRGRGLRGEEVLKKGSVDGCWRASPWEGWEPGSLAVTGS